MVLLVTDFRKPQHPAVCPFPEPDPFQFNVSQGVKVWIGFNTLYEHFERTRRFQKVGEFHDLVSICYLLKKGFVACG